MLPQPVQRSCLTMASSFMMAGKASSAVMDCGLVDLPGVLGARLPSLYFSRQSGGKMRGSLQALKQRMLFCYSRWSLRRPFLSNYALWIVLRGSLKEGLKSSLSRCCNPLVVLIAFVCCNSSSQGGPHILRKGFVGPQKAVHQ